MIIEKEWLRLKEKEKYGMFVYLQKEIVMVRAHIDLIETRLDRIVQAVGK